MYGNYLCTFLILICSCLWSTLHCCSDSHLYTDRSERCNREKHSRDSGHCCLSKIVPFRQPLQTSCLLSTGGKFSQKCLTTLKERREIWQNFIKSLLKSSQVGLIKDREFLVWFFYVLLMFVLVFFYFIFLKGYCSINLLLI